MVTLAQKETHHAAVTGPQRQPATGRQVKQARMAANFRHHRGKPAATKPLLKDPQGIDGRAHADQHNAVRIKAEPVKTGAIGLAGLAPGCGLHDPQDRTVILDSQTGRKGQRKAGRRAIAAGHAADFVQPITAQPTAQTGVQPRHPKRQHSATATR